MRWAVHLSGFKVKIIYIPTERASFRQSKARMRSFCIRTLKYPIFQVGDFSSTARLSQMDSKIRCKFGQIWSTFHQSQSRDPTEETNAQPLDFVGKLISIFPFRARHLEKKARHADSAITSSPAAFKRILVQSHIAKHDNQMNMYPCVP